VKFKLTPTLNLTINPHSKANYKRSSPPCNTNLHPPTMVNELSSEVPETATLPGKSSGSPKRQYKLRSNKQKKKVSTVIVLRKPRDGEAVTKVPSRDEKVMLSETFPNERDYTYLGSVEEYNEVDDIMNNIDELDIDNTNHEVQSKAASFRSKSAASRVGGASRMGSTADVSFDPLINPQGFLDGLEKAKLRSEGIYKADKELESTLNALIPLSEQFGANKEATILKNWENRKRGWNKFKLKVAKELGRNPDQLVISKADEYREQMEELQLIQSAIPAHERYGSNYWEMSLRGIGSR